MNNLKKELYLFSGTSYNQIIKIRGRKNIMRKLSIEKMETAKDTKKVDAVVGASFERSKRTDDMMEQKEENETAIGWWTVLICF